MAQKYMVVNRHEPDYCEPMEAALTHLPEHLEGQDLFCPCPYGEHGFYMILEGESSEAVIEGLPIEMRLGTTATQEPSCKAPTLMGREITLLSLSRT